MKKLTPDEFHALQKEWDKKLKASGFEDIEPLNDNGSRNTPFLKQHSIRFAERYNPGTEEYYRLAGQYLHDPVEAETLTEFERWLWEAHAEGIPTREMEKRWQVAPEEGNNYAGYPMPYGYLKRTMQRLKKKFCAWAQRETWMDQHDRDHEATGGIDNWLVAQTAAGFKGRPS